MLLSYGDDSKFTRGKTSIIWALVGFGLVLGSQMIVNFIAAQASIAAGPPLPFSSSWKWSSPPSSACSTSSLSSSS